MPGTLSSVFLILTHLILQRPRKVGTVITPNCIEKETEAQRKVNDLSQVTQWSWVLGQWSPFSKLEGRGRERLKAQAMEPDCLGSSPGSPTY